MEFIRKLSITQLMLELILAMILWAIVVYIRVKLLLAYQRKSELKIDLSKENLVIVLVISESNFFRSYFFSSGKLSYSKTSNDSSHIKVIFRSVNDLFSSIKKLQQNKKNIFSLFQSNKLKIEGDFSYLQKVFIIKNKIDMSH